MAGKTSMRTIILANSSPKDTWRLAPTVSVEQSQIRFLRNTQLHVWDCPGQDLCMQGYFGARRQMIFSGVRILIFVFDTSSLSIQRQRLSSGDDGYTIPGRPDAGSGTRELGEISSFQKALDGMQQYSPDAKVFCLLHKMDLIPTEDRQQLVAHYSKKFTKMATRSLFSLRCFQTSIWDETLFKAWSSMVCSIVPNMDKIETSLATLCELSKADEIVLFERETFLLITKATAHGQQCPTETLSHIMKKFKLSCREKRVWFDDVTLSLTMTVPAQVKDEVKSDEHSQPVRKLSVFIGPYTDSTSILICSTNKHIHMGAAKFNATAAKAHFEELMDPF